MKIVRIDWLDAATSHSWRADDDNGLEKITSVGYLVRQTKDAIVITTSFDAGGRCICPLAIPRKCVIRKVFLNLNKTKKPMSFKSVQKAIARKEGVSQKSAGAILATASRNASPAAKRSNPKLRRVKG